MMKGTRFSFLSVALVLALAVPAQQGLTGSRPNIVFVFSDDHACHAIGAYGSTFGATPRIDALAASGALFANNFCGNSLCGPSRATVLTGLHSHGNGFRQNGDRFDGSQVTFPKLLQQAGYQTALVGKWHLVSDPTGFDHWIVLPGQGEYYNPDFLTANGRQRHEGHVTDLITEFALDWLEQRDPDKPFVLMCQHKAPHRNWMPAPQELALFRDGDLPEPATLFDDCAGRAGPASAQRMEVARDLWLHYDLCLPVADGEDLDAQDSVWPGLWERMNDEQRRAWSEAFAVEDTDFARENPQGEERVRWIYQRYLKNYLRSVAGVDRSVGALLDWLDAHPDVKANTLFVYSSDQGFYLGDHGWYDKRWMYEESLRMPLVMSWPGRIEPGTVVRQMTQNIDFAPTFLELAGVPIPEGRHGTSLVPLLESSEAARGDVPWRDAIYYHYYESPGPHVVPAMYGVRTERHKLVRYYEPKWDCWEMFDLQADPHEMRSVADDERYTDVRRDLERRLRELRAAFGDGDGPAVADPADEPK
jgi:N-acetylglucosamine-6-sulfatase